MQVTEKKTNLEYFTPALYIILAEICYDELPFLQKIYLAVPGQSCSLWDLVLWPGIEPGSPEMRV